MNLGQKRRIHSRLFKLMQQLEQLSIEIDADLTKSEALDRLSITLPGIVATLLMLLRSLELEAVFEAEQHRLSEEIRRLYEEEQSRKKHLRRPEDDDPFSPEELIS